MTQTLTLLFPATCTRRVPAGLEGGGGGKARGVDAITRVREGHLEAHRLEIASPRSDIELVVMV
jgi:hypothetical protein